MAAHRPSITKTVVNYLFLWAIAIIFLFPLLWLIGTAFKSPSEDIFTFPHPTP